MALLPASLSSSATSLVSTSLTMAENVLFVVMLIWQIPCHVILARHCLCSFSVSIFMSNVLDFIHAGLVCVTNFLSSFCSTLLATSLTIHFLLIFFFLTLAKSPFHSLLLLTHSHPSFPLLFCTFWNPLCILPSLYITPWSPFLSQGSVREATVFGLEPYSEYSLRVEAVNGAGRQFIIIISSQGK